MNQVLKITKYPLTHISDCIHWFDNRGCLHFAMPFPRPPGSYSPVPLQSGHPLASIGFADSTGARNLAINSSASPLRLIFVAYPPGLVMPSARRLSAYFRHSARLKRDNTLTPSMFVCVSFNVFSLMAASCAGAEYCAGGARNAGAA